MALLSRVRLSALPADAPAAAVVDVEGRLLDATPRLASDLALAVGAFIPEAIREVVSRASLMSSSDAPLSAAVAIGSAKVDLHVLGRAPAVRDESLVLGAALVLEPAADPESANRAAADRKAAERPAAERPAGLEIAAKRAGLVAALPDGLVHIHADGTIECCNPAARHLLALATGSISMEGWLRTSRWHSRTAPSRSPFEDPLFRALGGFEPCSRPLRLTRDGHEAWLRLWRLDTDGPDPVLVRIDDATSEAASDERLERWAHVVVHDLKEPVRASTSLLQILSADLGDDLPTDNATCLERALLASRRAQAQVKGLADFVYDYHRDIEPTIVDLPAVVGTVLAELHPIVERLGATVTTEVPPRVWGDRRRLHALFLHLLDNALRFHAPDVPPRVEVTFQAADDGWRIEVADDGIGIPPEHRETVFDPLQRLARPIEPDQIGIGLAACRRIVELHGGQIGIDPTPSDGTRVWLTLPAVS